MNAPIPPPQSNSQPVAGLLIWPALLAALVTGFGSLWLTLGMDLRACPLCLYQRACVFCVIAILTVGVLARERHPKLLALVSLGPAAAAVAVCAYQNYLEQIGKLECPAGIANIGTAPQQALAAEAIVLVILLLASVSRAMTTGLALLLGLALGGLMIKTAPPPPDAPTKPYSGPFTTCRPPYIAPTQ